MLRTAVTERCVLVGVSIPHKIAPEPVCSTTTGISPVAGTEEAQDKPAATEVANG